MNIPPDRSKSTGNGPNWSRINQWLLWLGLLFIASVYFFPTGIVESPAGYLVYYGAADSASAVVEFSRADLMGALEAV